MAGRLKALMAVGRLLAEMDAITLTNTEPARGATKHMYAITPFGEEVLTWAGKMERYGRKRARERALGDAEFA